MADNVASTKITVDVSDLKRGITEAQKNISQLEAEFKASSAGMDDWKKSGEGLAQKLSTLKSVLDEQKKILNNYQEELARTKDAQKQNEESAEYLRARLKALADSGVDTASEEYKKLEAELADNLKEQVKQEKSIESLSKSITNYSGKINKTEKEIRQYTKASEDLEREENSLTHTVDKQSNELDDLKKRYADVVAVEGKNSAEAKELAKQITNLSKDLKSNKEALANGEKEADKLDDSLEKVENQSKSTGNSLGSLTDKLGNLAKKGLQAFATAVTGAIASMTAMSVSAGQYADEINTMSKVTGIATDDLQAYQYASELVDVSVETLAGALAKNTKSMYSASNGTKATMQAYEALGISVTDATGHLRDNEDVFWEAIDALGQMENETERDALSMQLFGRSAKDLNPLIEAGSEQMKNLKQEAHNLGLVMDEETLDSLNDFDDTLQVLKSSAKGLKNTLGTVLLPVLQDLSEEGTEIISEMSKGLKEAKGMDEVSKVISKAVEEAVNYLVENLPTFVNFGVDIVKAIGKGIFDNLDLILDTLGNLIKDAVDFIIQNLPKFLETGMQLITKILQGIAQALPDLIQKITDLIPALLDAFFANLDDIIDAGIQVIMALLKGIIEALPKIIDYLPTLIEHIIDALVNNIDKFIDAGIELFVAIVENLPKIIAGIVKAIPKIIDGIIKGFGSLFGKMAEIGGQMLQGLWEGISNAGQWLWDKISGFFGGIFDGIKSFFGIHSPSRLFRDEIGKNLALGIGEGFVGEMPSVIGNMVGALRGATDSLSFTPSLAMAGVGSTNYTQIINSPKALSRIDIYRDTRNMLDLMKG